MAGRSLQAFGPGRLFGAASETRTQSEWSYQHGREPKSSPWSEIAHGVWERRCGGTIIQARRGQNGRWWAYTHKFTYGGRRGFAREHTAKATATREAHNSDPPRNHWRPGPCG